MILLGWQVERGRALLILQVKVIVKVKGERGEKTVRIIPPV